MVAYEIRGHGRPRVLPCWLLPPDLNAPVPPLALSSPGAKDALSGVPRDGDARVTVTV